MRNALLSKLFETPKSGLIFLRFGLFQSSGFRHGFFLWEKVKIRESQIWKRRTSQTDVSYETQDLHVHTHDSFSRMHYFQRRILLDTITTGISVIFITYL